jgi:hypothetical protein
MSYFADIILFDSGGVSYSGADIETKACGGSEFSAVILLEEFAKLGKKVICLNAIQEPILHKNVLYLNFNEAPKCKCTNLIIFRTSVPPRIPHKNCIIWKTDLNSAADLIHYDILDQKKAKLVCLSHFQSNLFPDRIDKHVIPFIIPDWVYEAKASTNAPRSGFVYCSAVAKGLPETLRLWAFLKQRGALENETLSVFTPGYDNSPEFNPENQILGIKYIKSLPFKGVVETLLKSKSLFYANCLPETFCLSAVLCDILGLDLYIYCVNNQGSLPEVLSDWDCLTNHQDTFINAIKNKNRSQNNDPKFDFRAGTVMPLWNKLIL